MQKPQLHPKQQTGSVLFMALVFLVLTALIAVTIMDTSILSRKMAGNNQFKEDAMQVTEGVVNETVYNVIDLLGATNAPVVGDVICMTTSSDTGCNKKLLTISNEIQTAASSASLFYQAVFFKEETQASGGSTRLSETNISEGLLLRFVDVVGSYDGVNSGLSQASLAIGIKNTALSANGGGKKDVEATVGADGTLGTGTGGYSVQ